MSKTRVLVIGPFDPGQLPESFARAFECLGYEVFRFDSDRAYFEAGLGARNRVTRRLLRRVYWDRMNMNTVEIVRCVRPALVLCVKGTYLHPETIRRVRGELGVPFLNYYADNPYCGIPSNPNKPSVQRRDLIDVLREYTRVWIWERGMAKRLAADGVASAYLPFGVDSGLFRPLEPTGCADCGQQHTVIFIGKHSDKRQAHIGAVRGQSVALWGSRWSRAATVFNGRHRIHQRAAFGEDCARLYSSAAVSLNVVDDLNMPGHNMRTFEIPAAGGLMLSTYTAEQAEFFPEGEAALYYRDPGEMDGKIERALKDRTWAERLKQQAIRIAADHHYTVRVKVMTAELGL
jgi:hypothetical protein